MQCFLYFTMIHWVNVAAWWIWPRIRAIRFISVSIEKPWSALSIVMSEPKSRRGTSSSSWGEGRTFIVSVWLCVAISEGPLGCGITMFVFDSVCVSFSFLFLLQFLSICWFFCKRRTNARRTGTVYFCVFWCIFCFLYRVPYLNAKPQSQL